MTQPRIVMIVEDDDSIREVLEVTIETSGYQVYSAANGQEALEKLPSIPRPCLILLDLMMPVLDGWGFMEAIEKKGSLAEIPIVVITAFRDKAAESKAKETLNKPLDLDLLFKTIEKYCG